MQYRAVSLRVVLVTIVLTMAVSGIGLLAHNHMRYLNLIHHNKAESVMGFVKSQASYLLDSSREKIIRVSMALQAKGSLRTAIREKNANRLTSILDNQFNQYLFTTGGIELLGIYVFDDQLNLIAGSSKGKLGKDASGIVCSRNLDNARLRTGHDRLKSLQLFCSDNHIAHIGILSAVGSFKAMGYLLYVVNPSSILKSLGDNLGMPVQILNPDDSIAYRNENWPSSVSQSRENYLTLTHTVSDDLGQPLVLINLIHDLSDFNQALQGEQRSTAINAVLIFSFAIILSLLLMRVVLRAVNSLEQSANSLRQGDFKTVAKTRFSEFNVLIGAFNSMAADISALFQRLTKARQESEQASRAKSMFLANMSHEIRTPMNAVLGFTQILLRDPELPGRYRRPVESIEKAGNHLLGLINDILDLSKIEAGAAEVHAVDFDLQALVDGMGDMFKLRCKQNGLVWKLDNQLQGNCLVHGDQNKIRQVLVNFLGNAVKFTEQGSVKLQVSNHGDNYRFEVVDSGVGISPSGLLDVVKPFQQSDAGFNKGGTGLGLAIAKRQLELMGSEIEIDSHLGKGSRFSFSLYLPPAKNEVSAKRESRRHSQLYLPKGCVVNALVVDDVEDNREVLAHLLEKTGVTVRTAVNGKDAVQKISQYIPDIVFMDIRMPLMNGSQAMLHIKNNYPEVVCIAVTSSVLYHERAKYLEQGFDDLVGKPFRFEQIIMAIEKSLDVGFEEYVTGQSGNADGDAHYDELQSVKGICVPKSIYSKLVAAMEVNALTDMGAIVQELRKLNSETRYLADLLERHLANFETDDIAHILAEVNCA